jgi:hypothetical protein
VRNRLRGYEKGWLSFLVAAGLATREEARQAVQRLAKDATKGLDRQQEEWRRARRRRRDEEKPEGE